ncbi:hypothetical protein GIB67_028357 [Kingdonia uniflora]|uniref:Nodulin-like domain-containing protein n=1 Tax=Kingdonia uniflora TaxID=39325 RepID=A0A7J7MHR8_9MAGN|nr:hypothetical protein GIB67_028357 [Kingdonia uniflora]
MVTLKAGSRPPWVGLGATVWVSIASGNAYNFPLYSHSLKSTLGFNQQQLTMLGVANDIDENVGILPGIISNKYPPWVVLMVGGACCFLGYEVIWLSLSQTVSLPYWLAEMKRFAKVDTSVLKQHYEKKVQELEEEKSVNGWHIKLFRV